MATEVISTIRASGGDYTSLTSWEAGEQGDLIALDQIHTGVCYNDWPGGIVDRLIMDGSNTDATRYMKLTVAEGHRHDGTPLSGFYITGNASGGQVVLKDPYSELWWLEVVATSSGDGIAIRFDAATYCKAYNCLGSAPNGTTGMKCAFGTWINGGYAYLFNCLAYNSPLGFFGYSTNRIFVSNCTAANCSTGYSSGTTNSYVKNSVAYNCTTDFSGSWSSTLCESNASSGAGAVGANPISNITSAAFADTANNDFHLSAGSVLRGAGVNLYSDFQTDIDGDTWPSSGAWDIGFDYYVAAGGLTINSITASGVTPTTATITLGMTR